MGDTEDLLYMPFAKLTEGGSLPSLGGRYQLFLASRSKIAKRLRHLFVPRIT
jgi:hypothetical protein